MINDDKHLSVGYLYIFCGEMPIHSFNDILIKLFNFIFLLIYVLSCSVMSDFLWPHGL